MMCCNKSLVANHNGSKKPAQSVKVVIIMDDATAGSIPTLFNTNGIDAPVNPATIRLPVIAKNKTRPSIGFGIIKQGNKKNDQAIGCTIYMPTKNSFKTVL